MDLDHVLGIAVGVGEHLMVLKAVPISCSTLSPAGLFTLNFIIERKWAMMANGVSISLHNYFNCVFWVFNCFIVFNYNCIVSSSI